MPSRCSGCPALRPAAATRRIGASTARSSTTAISSTYSTSGRIYKTQNSSAENYATAGSGEAFSGYEVAIGAEYAGASVDGFYTKMRDAVSVGTLSTEQLATLPAANLSPSTSVSGTISDNASYGVMASYALAPVLPILPVTVYGGFQHITYMNPSIPLTVGFDDIGGYTLGAVNNTAYAKQDKQLNVYWLGARYAVTPQFTAAIAYYGEKQFAYATGTDAGCSTTVSGACNGNFNALSVSLDYHFTKRFDTYAGAMWSAVSHGLASGYINTHHDRSHDRRAVLLLIDRPDRVYGVSWPIRGHETRRRTRDPGAGRSGHQRRFARPARTRPAQEAGGPPAFRINCRSIRVARPSPRELRP